MDSERTVQCEVRTVMTGDIYNEEAGDKWTLDTILHSAQVLANVYSEGDTQFIAQ